MFLIFSRKKWFEQTSWSIGYCSTCNRTEAIRIGRMISATMLYGFVTVSRQVGSEVSYCDFCSGSATQYQDAKTLGVEDWTYRDGIATLFELCAPGYDFGLPRFSTEDEIIGLLRATSRSTSYSKIDLNTQWLPPLIGACAGAVLAIVLVPMLFDEHDDFRAIFLPLLGGGCVGGLLGILIGGIRSCNKLARTTIEYNALKYNIDPDLLLDSAIEFPNRIRHAARIIADKLQQGDR